MDILSFASKTQDIYERNGARFDAERPKILFEKKWLKRFQYLLPDKAKILDVGCGAGEPIAQYFIERGYDLTGIDFSTSMLDIAKSRFPNNPWHFMDMRVLDLNEKFDGIIAWHSFFHLTKDDQKTTLQKFADHLAPNGVLMLTVGHEEGEVIGTVGEDKVYHSSLSFEQYESCLNKLDMDVIKFVREDPECYGSTILLAQKRK